MAEPNRNIKLTGEELGHFSHASIYGDPNGGFMVHRVVVLLWNINGSNWQKEICGQGYGDPTHAEEQMLIKLRQDENHLGGTLNLYLSASPCSVCSDAIVQFKRNNPDLSVNIVFSSFYNVYKRYRPIEITPPWEEPWPTHLENWEGLKTLYRTDGISLGIFNGRPSWEPILPCVDATEDEMNTLVNNKAGREATDQLIMDKLVEEISTAGLG